MYIPKHFRATDRAVIEAFIQQHAFGQLVSQVNDRPYVTHLPFLLSDDGQTLYAHLARQNPQLDNLGEQTVMVTFQGPHDYISPSWYEQPGVPTWNYQAVHVYGTVRRIEDAAELSALVNQLSVQYEQAQPVPWSPQYKAAMLNAIVGIAIDINDIEAKFKLSQNRSDADRQAVIARLQERSSSALAEAMQQSLNAERDLS
ncbi:FMN-binding negative transcriptional regulator [Reinekea blandensis]|uniref:Transcriptional repressor of sporulation and degradative enzyme production n=1 Tax=Reinekea blandensis MED297 TaxID=314283 RepID=A4BCQ8_9GAMM|nr:FMN-binding negative transcriptional regulator [Reinekea blandensis]EAR09990.1 transcriptional repressor of sporulation and degradative enzyme production [Reinekea sp. MED297] [Reinekea blandensis MED297]